MSETDKALAPNALTDRDVAALERAIRAEGYRILRDPVSGEIKLEKVPDGGKSKVAGT